MKRMIKNIFSILLFATALSTTTGYALFSTSTSKSKSAKKEQTPAIYLDMIRINANTFMNDEVSPAEQMQAKKNINEAMRNLKNIDTVAHDAIQQNVTDILSTKTKKRQAKYDELVRTIASLINGMTIDQINKLNAETKQLAKKEKMMQQDLAILQEEVAAGRMTPEQAALQAEAMGKSVAQDQQKVLESSSYLNTLGATLASPFQWIGNKIFDEETSNLKRAMYTVGATAAAVALGAVAYNYFNQPVEVPSVTPTTLRDSLHNLNAQTLLQQGQYDTTPLTEEGQAELERLRNEFSETTQPYTNKVSEFVKPYYESAKKMTRKSLENPNLTSSALLQQNPYDQAPLTEEGQAGLEELQNAAKTYATQTAEQAYPYVKQSLHNIGLKEGGTIQSGGSLKFPEGSGKELLEAAGEKAKPIFEPVFTKGITARENELGETVWPEGSGELLIDEIQNAIPSYSNSQPMTPSTTTQKPKNAATIRREEYQKKQANARADARTKREKKSTKE